MDLLIKCGLKVDNLAYFGFFTRPLLTALKIKFCAPSPPKNFCGEKAGRNRARKILILYFSGKPSITFSRIK